MTRLGPVAHDREAARRAPSQQHPPLGVGELLCLVDDDVSERPGEHVRVEGGERGLVDQGGLRVRTPQHRHEALAVVGGDQVVDNAVPALSFEREHGLPLTPHTVRGRVADALARGVEQREVGEGPCARVVALQQRDLPRGQPGRALLEVGGHREEVAEHAGRVEERPGAGEGAPQRGVLRELGA